MVRSNYNEWTEHMSFRGLAPFPSKNEKPSARSCKKGYKLNSHKEAVFLRGTKKTFTLPGRGSLQNL